MNEIIATIKEWPFLNPILAILATLLVAIAALIALGFSLDRLAKKSVKNQTQIIFAKHILNAIIIAFAIFNVLIQIEPLKKLALSIAASSSIIAVAVALASQEAMTNVVSGFFISIFKPFKIGDRIKVTEKNIVGFIEEITMRHTVIKTFEQTRVIIPNSVMNTAIVENYNLMLGNICSFLELGISYNSNIDAAMKAIEAEVLAHPSFCDMRTDDEKNQGMPAVITRVIGLGSSSVDLKTTLWSADAASAYALTCDLRKSIKERFDREGIEIPFTQIVLHHADNSTLVKK